MSIKQSVGMHRAVVYSATVSIYKKDLLLTVLERSPSLQQMNERVLLGKLENVPGAITSSVNTLEFQEFQKHTPVMWAISFYCFFVSFLDIPKLESINSFFYAMKIQHWIMYKFKECDFTRFFMNLDFWSKEDGMFLYSVRVKKKIFHFRQVWNVTYVNQTHDNNYKKHRADILVQCTYTTL